MNAFKKYLGWVWLVLGPLAIIYLLKMAAAEITAKPVIDTKVQWAVFIIVFVPISAGLTIFGYYAIKGEYSSLPQSSNEL